MENERTKKKCNLPANAAMKQGCVILKNKINFKKDTFRFCLAIDLGEMDSRESNGFQRI